MFAKRRSAFVLLVSFMLLNAVQPVFASAKDEVAQERLNALIEAKVIPDYVAQQGLFECDPNVWGIVMTSDGVNLRSQPNTKAHSVGKLNRYYPGVLGYSGLWTHPKDGSRWYIGVYTPKYPDESEAIVGWVSAKYARAVNAEEFKAYQEQEFKVQKQREQQQAKKTAKSPKTAKSKKVDNRVFQCRKCGQYYRMGGALERVQMNMLQQLFGPYAGLVGVGGDFPPPSKCQYGGNHVWVRVK